MHTVQDMVYVEKVDCTNFKENVNLAPRPEGGYRVRRINGGQESRKERVSFQCFIVYK